MLEWLLRFRVFSPQRGRPRKPFELAGKIEPIGYHQSGTQRKAAIVDRECFVVAPFSGHYESVLECGATVKRGDIIGLLHNFDYIDDEPWPAQAAVDGIVVAQAWVAPIPRGQHIVVVGREC